MLNDNEKGYLIYRWEQVGYGFYPQKYDRDNDYKTYLNYYTDEEKNKNLLNNVLSYQSYFVMGE